MVYTHLRTHTSVEASAEAQRSAASTQLPTTSDTITPAKV